MSFSFFTWLHDEVMALRAAVARLESHTGSPESKPAPKPADAVPPAVEPAKPKVDPPNDNIGGTALSPDARWVAYLAKYGNDLWAVMKGENMSITAPELPLAAAAGFTISDGIKQFVAGNPGYAPGPAFDAHKTVLDLSDAGGLFEPAFGTTTYTITGPLKVQLVIDGTEVLTEKASMSIDGKPELFAGVNPTADVIGPGPHSVVVQSNVVTGRTRLQVQPA